MSECIKVENLVISYNAKREPAVNGASFTIPSGQIFGLLGSNGAGKTSTMRAIAGVIPATSGSIYVSGYNMKIASEADFARARLGYCPDTAGLIRQATIREHIGLTLGLRDQLSAWPYAMELVQKFNLESFLDNETTGFSHGMSRRLSVILAILGAKDVLILDEPFDGVDPLGVEVTLNLIKMAKESGLAVIVSTHLLSVLSGISDRICVMISGKIVDDVDAVYFQGDAGSNRYDKLLKASCPSQLLKAD